MRNAWRLVGVAAVAWVFAWGSPVPLTWADGYGTVTGQFVLDGPIPQLKPLVAKGDAAAKDSAVCAKDNVPDESVVVDPQTKGIANVFVFMPKAPANIHPDLKDSKEKDVKFDQKGCRFIPHAMVLRTDQTVAILSGDAIVHNTHVNTINNAGQNQTIAAEDRTGQTRWSFQVPERYVTKVNCDIHGWMNAWWLIIDHPYAAVTDKTGHFTIEKVPSGPQQFVAWQEAEGWVFGKERSKRSRTIEVKPDQTNDIGIIKIPASAFEKN